MDRWYYERLTHLVPFRRAFQSQIVARWTSGGEPILPCIDADRGPNMADSSSNFPRALKFRCLLLTQSYMLCASASSRADTNLAVMPDICIPHSITSPTQMITDYTYNIDKIVVSSLMDTQFAEPFAV